MGPGMLLDRSQLMCYSKTQLWLLSALATACPPFTIVRASAYREQWPQQDQEASVMKLYWFFFFKYG